MLVAYIVSTVCAQPVAQFVWDYMPSNTVNPLFRVAISATVLFILVSMAMRWLLWRLASLFPMLPNKVNRAGGAVLGVVNGILLLVPLIWSAAFLHESYAMGNGVEQSRDIWPQGEPKVVLWSRSIMAKLTHFGLSGGDGDASSSDSPAMGLAKAFAEHPTVLMVSAKKSLASPEFQQLASDPDIADLVHSNDVEGLMQSPQYQIFLTNPDVQTLYRLIQGEQALENRQMAENVIGVWTQVEMLQNHPEVAALKNDSEVRDFLSGHGKITPSLLAKLQRLLSVWSSLPNQFFRPHEGQQTGIHRWLDEQGNVHYTDAEHSPEQNAKN